MDNNSLMLVDNNGSFEIDDHSHVDASHNPSMTLLTPSKPPNEDEPNADTDDSLLLTPGTLPVKRRRKKSMVWDHFTIETVSPGSTKACCKHCRKSFAYINGQKLAGTSHLKRHIQLGICPMFQDSGQIVEFKDPSSDPPKKRQRSSSAYINVPLDQGRCYNEMAKMIIMHEYPLHMVEHSGFIDFVHALRPQFNMPSFNTVHGDCVSMYLSEKQKLSNFISEIPGRVNLTVDLWTSNQSVGYAFVTGHFIDKDWNLTRRLLNVNVVPSPDSDFALNQPIADCLSDWNLERRLSSITVGQSVVNKTSIENLRCCLSARNQHVLSGQLLLGNCYARILSSMAQDLLGDKDLEPLIKKVRDSVKYVKTNDSCGERFDELKRQLQTPSTKDLLIDNQTKWDSSYNMLLAACGQKEVFSCLGNCDINYKVSISPEEWRKIEILCSCLKILYDAANYLTGTTRLTANNLFLEMMKLKMDLIQAAMSEDPDVRNLANPLKEKFDEYWGQCYLLIAAALVMDPRFKMKLIEFNFTKAFGEDADKWIRSVDDAMHDLYLDYAEQSHPMLDAYGGQRNDGFSEANMSQVHFHHEMPHEYNHSNGLDDQIYEQPDNGSNPLNKNSRDHVLDDHDLQEVSQTQVNQLAVESLPHVEEMLEDTQPVEESAQEAQQMKTHDDIQPVDDVGHETEPVDELLEDTQPVEESAQEAQQIEKHDDIQPVDDVGHETEPVEELLEDTQPVEEFAQEAQQMEKHDDIQSVDDVGHETQPVEELVEDTEPVEEVAQEAQQMEKHDDIQSVDDIGHETQPVEELLEDTESVEEVAHEAEMVEEKRDDSLPVDEAGIETQAADEILEDTKPIEEAAQEGQPVEQTANHSQNPQNTDDIICQDSREGDAAVQPEQESDEGIASEQQPRSHTMPEEEEAQYDSKTHAMPQEEATFTISQEGHHVDVLLQEGHHLEASSQEFPLICIGDGFSDFELYISEVGCHQQMKSELDQYLEESLIPRSQDFEVLGWWSLNRTKYPTLSKMAADVLSVPFCTVSPDSVFDTEVKKMDSYRSSLRHVTLEALFCAKDWFKQGCSSSTSESNLKKET